MSRAGEKLNHALDAFAVNVTARTCADLGCNAGGFVDCLLQRGAAKVYAIDTGYGMLAWKLRQDARVVVMERTNAMHVTLPEAVGIVTIDVAWTKQRHVLPAAKKMLSPDGLVITLIKPHYEAAAAQLRRGVLVAEAMEGVLAQVRQDINAAGFEIVRETTSPLIGAGGNSEYLALLRLAAGH